MTGAEELAPLAWLAGQLVELDEDELRGALRRSMLLLAAGGDPHRELTLDSRAVSALADELDEPARREALRGGLEGLWQQAPAPAVGLIETMLADQDLAWRAYACALLAEELGE